jgi:hypothetical protein
MSECDCPIQGISYEGGSAEELQRVKQARDALLGEETDG